MSVARNVTEVALALVGLALAGLLIGRAGNTAQVVSAVGQSYGDLLRAATAQNASGGFN